MCSHKTNISKKPANKKNALPIISLDMGHCDEETFFLPVCIPKSQNHRLKKHKKGIHDERVKGLKNQSPGSDSSL